MAKKRHILCPYCFNGFDNNEVEYQCENMERDSNGEYRCERDIDHNFNTHWKVEGTQIRHIFTPKKGLFSSFTGPSLEQSKCNRCGYPSRRFVCPHCHNWLPSNMIEEGSEIISVVGGPASGKTNYIVALIHQLRKYGHKLRLQVTPQQVYRDNHPEESTQNLFKNKDNQLFKDYQVLNKTAVEDTTQKIPWIFQLKHLDTKKTIYLVFYDTAGENFNDESSVSNNVKYLQYSEGVIVVLDTLSLNKIQEIIKSKGLSDLSDISTPIEDTGTTLNNFISNKAKDLHKKPFAFVFSKFDTVLNNARDMGFSTDAFFDGSSFADSSYINSGKFDVQKIDEISDTIKGALCEYWNDGNEADFVSGAEANWGDNHKFFGVSSFGCMPSDAGELEEVKPYRVMDPLVWILYKLGGFEIQTINEPKKK